MSKFESKVLIVCTVFGALFIGCHLLGDDISIRSYAASSTGDWTETVERITYLVVWILMIGILLITILSTPSRAIERLRSLSRGPDADNLFLGVEFAKEPNFEDKRIGYLRSLGLRQAEFVSDVPILRGRKVQFNAASLNGYQGQYQNIKGQVLRCRPLIGATESFLIQVRLEPLSSEQKSDLRSYLQYLVEPLASRLTTYKVK